jgi:nitrate/TMAO reductase-like tetraheme cytochrome c subunit
MKLGQFTVAGYAVGLMVGLGLVLGYGAIEVSSTPAFCGTCHVMAPYYDSWQTSKHASIACVDCHIPPGVTAELRKKYEAVAMVARYFTGTYGTNPWAEIEDAACLECHERRLLMGQEVFGDVLFDHGPHLTELRRGKRLRCTSCHSQIVQGSHITVTHTTCTLCHFKGQPPGEGTAECTLCHQVPDRIVDAAGLEFDHGDVSRFGMDCQSCHTPPGPEAGSVPRERCVTCHNDPPRLAEYDNEDLLHRTHVSEHKVECTNCHLEIEHVRPRHLEAARTECSTCHGGGHSPQRDLYAGLGGKGVPPTPDVMYRAGVRCEGCHLDHGEGQPRTAGEISCMSCHGPGYRGLYQGWTETLRQRTSGLRRQFDRSLAASPSPVFEDAQANLQLVERGRGIHNVPYSLALLSAAHDQLNEARQARGLPRLSSPWPEAPYESSCSECHAGVEGQRGRAFGRSFPHQPHVVSAGLECGRCHSTHEDRVSSGAAPITLTAGDCAACHHGDSGTDCAACHGGIRQRTYAVEYGDFAHASHVDDMEIACTDCHGEGPGFVAKADREVCSGCH